MKTKRKLLYAMLVGIALIMALLLSALPTSESKAIAIVEEKLSNPSNSTYQGRVKQSKFLHSQFRKEYLIKRIKSNDREIDVFKDEYAGMYIDDNGFLNIGVVNSESAKLNKKASKMNNGNVIYRDFDFSYNFLQEIMLVIEDMMLEYDVYAVGIDDETNSVFVELINEETIDVIISKLQEIELYEPNAIAFEVEPSMNIENNATAYGGESLYHRIDSNQVSWGSICVNAIDNVTGKIGVITNEHVAKVTSGNPNMIYGGHVTFNADNSVSFSENRNIGVIGAKGQRSGSVDAAFIPYETAEDWSVTADARYDTTTFTNIRLGSDEQIVRGQPTKRVGQTTGVTIGEIRSTNVSVTIDGTKITNTFRYTNEGQGGDSGGPVYYDDGNTLYLIGMHFASGYVLGGGDQGYACRITNVMATLNVTPLTNDSFNTVSLTSNTLCLNSVNFSPVGAFNMPTSIMGKIVSAIGNSAFENQRNISSTIIPANVMSIGTQAFANCTNMLSVVFEDNSQLNSIGNAAFFNCSSLSSITIPTYVTGLGANTFNNCYNLTSVLFEAGSYLTTIGNSAFENCSSLESITIPAGVASLGYNAFSNCYAMTNVKFATGCQLVRMENAAFYGCTSLDNVVLPASLSYIGYDVFSGCNMLRSVIISSNITTIGGNAFANCHNLSVYTSHVSKPSGWLSNWNVSNRPVVWNCTITNDYIVSFIKSANTPVLSSLNAPYRKGYTFSGWFTGAGGTGEQITDILTVVDGTTLYAKWDESSCVAEGTLITLADGSKVAVENLTGNEYLLVWNMFTGMFDSAPILFIDSDEQTTYEVIHLFFNDGTEVQVIDEHAFFDINLNQYVFLRNDAEKYIGHYFNKQTTNNSENLIYTNVQLISVQVETKVTRAYSPVTYGYLCYYVNGMLSMPGATEGLINILEVNPETMAYDEESLQIDIDTYGIYTYEELSSLIPMPQDVYDAFNGNYLKISIGKGLITLEEISALFNRYAEFFA